MVGWLMAAGAGLMVAGAARYAFHTSRLVDDPLAFYLAQRCNDAAATLLPSGPAGLMAGHCWGCPAMAIGAVLILAAFGLSRRRRAGFAGR